MERGKKRSKTKYPGLVKGVNAKTRHEYMDFDYLHELSPEEKQWLSNVMEEWMSGNFNHEGEIFHKTKEERKTCYDRNNARNRCMLSKAKATGMVQYEVPENLQQMWTSEDDIIDSLEEREFEIKEALNLKEELEQKIAKLKMQKNYVEEELKILEEHLSRLNGSSNNSKRRNKLNDTK